MNLRKLVRLKRMLDKADFTWQEGQSIYFLNYNSFRFKRINRASYKGRGRPKNTDYRYYKKPLGL